MATRKPSRVGRALTWAAELALIQAFRFFFRMRRMR